MNLKPVKRAKKNMTDGKKWKRLKKIWKLKRAILSKSTFDWSHRHVSTLDSEIATENMKPTAACAKSIFSKQW